MTTLLAALTAGLLLGAYTLAALYGMALVVLGIETVHTALFYKEA